MADEVATDSKDRPVHLAHVWASPALTQVHVSKQKLQPPNPVQSRQFLMSAQTASAAGEWPATATRMNSATPFIAKPFYVVGITKIGLRKFELWILVEVQVYS